MSGLRLFGACGADYDGEDKKKPPLYCISDKLSIILNPLLEPSSYNIPDSVSHSSHAHDAGEPSALPLHRSRSDVILTSQRIDCAGHSELFRNNVNAQ